MGMKGINGLYVLQQAGFGAAGYEKLEIQLAAAAPFISF
jgi:hypothetical protein